MIKLLFVKVILVKTLSIVCNVPDKSQIGPMKNTSKKNANLCSGGCSGEKILYLFAKLKI